MATMRKSVSLILVLFSWFVSAEEVTLPNQQKYSFIEVDKVRISKTEDCIRKSCAALKVAVLANRRYRIVVGPGGVNPASSVCRELKGTDLIGVLASGDEISICQFKDESFLVTWDLLNRQR